MDGRTDRETDRQIDRQTLNTILHAQLQPFIPFLLTPSCFRESLESRTNPLSLFPLGPLRFTLAHILVQRWPCYVSHFGSGKPKSQLTMSNVPSDFVTALFFLCVIKEECESAAPWHQERIDHDRFYCEATCWDTWATCMKVPPLEV